MGRGGTGLRHHRTLWEEYWHEVQDGPHDRGWASAIGAGCLMQWRRAPVGPLPT
jgi:hypothetical protein